MSINYYKNNAYTLILKYSIQKMLSSDNAGLPQSFHLFKKKKSQCLWRAIKYNKMGSACGSFTFLESTLKII